LLYLYQDGLSRVLGMRILVNGQEITTAKVCVLPDVFETEILLEDASGVFYDAKCNKNTIITVFENLTGWGDLPFKQERIDVPHS
jgi:hypothetical protein